jgi:uncharacterized membrane protein YadS
MADNKKQSVCVVCKLIRFYLLIAVPIIIAIAMGPETSLLQDFDLTEFASTIFGVGFVSVVLWRAYVEYWRK